MRTVTDMAGRAVHLPAQIVRVVTLGSLPVLNSFVFTLGEGGRSSMGWQTSAGTHTGNIS